MCIVESCTIVGYLARKNLPTPRGTSTIWPSETAVRFDDVIVGNPGSYAMTKEQAIEIASNHLLSEGAKMKSNPPFAFRKEGDMRGSHRFGWVVIVQSNVPIGIEPDSIHVEVYEPDGEVYGPQML